MSMAFHVPAYSRWNSLMVEKLNRLPAGRLECPPTSVGTFTHSDLLRTAPMPEHIDFCVYGHVSDISYVDSQNDITYLDDIRYGGKRMSNTLTITGYEMDDFCSHCGRKLVHCVNTAELGLIGADCFNKLIVADRKKYSGNGKPGASLVREMAKVRDRYSDEGMKRLGRHPSHFIFEMAA